MNKKHMLYALAISSLTCTGAINAMESEDIELKYGLVNEHWRSILKNEENWVAFTTGQKPIEHKLVGLEFYLWMKCKSPIKLNADEAEKLSNYYLEKFGPEASISKKAEETLAQIKEIRKTETELAQLAQKKEKEEIK